jgi:hypothetical protein
MGSGGMTIAGDSFKEGMDAEERERKPGYTDEWFTINPDTHTLGPVMR